MIFEIPFYVFAVLLVLVGLNLVCWLVFKRWPLLLRSENERLRIDYFSRLDGELKQYIPEWFDIKAEQWSEFARECNMIGPGSHVHDPFVEIKHPPVAGRFHNFHPEGFRVVRDQGPWPIASDFFNIFFFGGSTTVNVGPDWTAIPSYLQEDLNRRGATDRPVRVYNFGCGAYFSTQERIRFQQLLLDGAVPDMVLFLDGVNEFYFFDGRPSIAGFFQHALDTHNQENAETNRNRLSGRPKWLKASEFMTSLPLFLAVDAVGRWLARRNAKAEEVLYRPIPVEPAALVPAMERYLENKRQIEAICREYGIRAAFVWQPTPAYKYDLQHHVALSRHYGLGGHERSGIGYSLMAEMLEARPLGTNFIWLADIQEGEERALYLDSVHYTSGFSQVIARHISEALISRELIPRNAIPILERLGRARPAAPTKAESDGINRLTGSTAEHYQPAKVDVRQAVHNGPLKGEPVIRLSSSTDKSEHYAVLIWGGSRPGYHTFSVYVLRDGKADVRLQLHDDQGNGAIADYVMSSGVYNVFRVGKSSGLALEAEHLSGGWMRLALIAELAGSQGSVIVQLVKPGCSTNFSDRVPDLVVQGPMVEAGGKPSSYSAPAN